MSQIKELISDWLKESNQEIVIARSGTKECQ